MAARAVPKRHRAAALAYFGGLATATAIALDEWLDLRKWRTVRHVLTTPVSVDMKLHTRVRAAEGEAGQGCVDWPAGRVLLQWAVDGGVPLRHGSVLEVGAGVGVTSIGLALAASCSSDAGGGGGSDGDPTRVLATDVCDSALANLHRNAAENEAPALLRVERWDAAGGTEAVRRLSRLVDPRTLTHVIGADIVSVPIGSGGGGGNAAGGEAAGGDGLEATLAALLAENPALRVTLLLFNRVSGGAVTALAGAAGVPEGGCTLDPALARFERRCAAHGLRACRSPVPEGCLRHVAEALPLRERGLWALGGVWDGLQLYEVRSGPLK